jgi:hypothetical protein
MIVAPNFSFDTNPGAGLRRSMHVGDKTAIQSAVFTNYTIYTLYVAHGSGSGAQITGEHFLRVPPGWFVVIPLWDDYINVLLDVAPDGTTGTAIANPFLMIELTGLVLDPQTTPLLQTSTTIAGTVTVSGTVAVSNFPATQPVSGTVAVSNFPATQPVSGTVAVSNFPATQPVSGTVSVGNFPATQPVSLTTSEGTPLNTASLPELQLLQDIMLELYEIKLLLASQIPGAYTREIGASH